MSNALLVKNVNFRQNSVETFPIQGSDVYIRHLYENVGNVSQKYLTSNSSSGVYSYKDMTNGTEHRYFPISAGEYLYVSPQTARFDVGIIKGLPKENNQAAAFTANCGYYQKLASKLGGMCLLAEEDGYVFVYDKSVASGVTTNIFPEDIYISNAKPVSRTLDTPTYYNVRSLQSDGTFPSPGTTVNDCRGFNVFAGETINITANSEHGAKCALMKMDKYIPYQTGTSLINYVAVAAGQSEQIVVPRQCMLLVQYVDDSVDVSPSVLTVTAPTT